MANVGIPDSTGAVKTFLTTTTGGVEVPAHYETDATGANATAIAAHGNSDAQTTSASTWSKLVGSLNMSFNGTTWDRIRSGLGDAAAATGLANLGNMIYNGATWDRLRSATADALASTGLLASANMVWNGTTWDRVKSAPGAPGVLAANTEGTKATYRYAQNSFAMVAAPTDAIIIQGSASKTLRIKRIQLTGAATAAGTMPVNLIKRSTADATNGVLTGVTPSKLDSGDAAATGVVSTVGTANFSSLGTSAGLVGAARLCLTALATGLGITPLLWEWGGRNAKACILRGTSEFLCINFAGAAIPSGGVIDYEIEIEEDAS